jgi:hypothetical protein
MLGEKLYRSAVKPNKWLRGCLIFPLSEDTTFLSRSTLGNSKFTRYLRNGPTFLNYYIDYFNFVLFLILITLIPHTEQLQKWLYSSLSLCLLLLRKVTYWTPIFRGLFFAFTKGCCTMELLVSHQYLHWRFLWSMEKFIIHQYLLRRLLWKLTVHLIINSHKIKSPSIPI